MRIADRIILTLYTILMAAVSLLVVCFVAGAFAAEEASRYLYMVPGRWEIAVGGILMFLVSIRLLVAGVTRSGPRDIAVCTGADGAVRVSIAAVESFVEKTVAQVRGVHNVKTRMYTSGDSLKAKVVAGVLPDTNIPEISKLMQDKIKSGVKETVGREVAAVEILFNTISHEAKNKQRFE